MNITVNENRTVEKKYTDNEGSQNENRITELTFTLPAIYDDFTHKIVFITEDGNYTDYIENDDTYILKNNVTKYRKVKSYVWLTDSVNNKDFRSELFDLEFNYNEDPSDYIPTEEEKSQIELLMEELDEKIQEVTALEENVYTKTETDTLLSGKLSTTLKGANNGLAELDSSGKVPSTQLPSYVDDIIEGYYYNNKFYNEAAHTTEITPETGKIYVDLTTNKTYRWSGTAYVEISESLALGETSSTAYRGDRGKIAYDHAADNNKVSSAKTKKFYKVGVTAEGHISEVEEIVKSDLTDLGVEDTSNKIDELSSSSTNTQYVGAKAIYDELKLKEVESNKVTELDNSDEHYPSSNAVKKVTDNIINVNNQQNLLLDALYQIAPKTDYGEGTDITLENTLQAKLDYKDTDGKEKIGFGDIDQDIPPSDYQRVEYIETNGNQVIDTNYVLDDSNIKIETKIYTANMPSNEQVIISNYKNTGPRFALGLYQQKIFLYTQTLANVVTDTLTGSQTLEFSAEVNYNNSYRNIILNNQEYKRADAVQILSDQTIKLFARDLSDTTRSFIGRVYYLKLYVAGKLKFDFVPCFRKSDNVIGLYDLVSNTFFTNAGTENFTKGSNIPSPEIAFPIKSVTGNQTLEKGGINLWGDFTYERISNGITHTYNLDGSITVKGIATADSFSITTSIAVTQGIYKTLPAGTYVISGATENVSLQIIDTSGNTIANTSSNTTFTLNNETNVVIRAVVLNETNINNGVILKILLEEGSSASSYEPYITPIIKTLSLGTEKIFDDGFISKEDDGWYINNYFKEIEIDDTFTWTMDSNESWAGNRFTCQNIPSLGVSSSTTFTDAYNNYASIGNVSDYTSHLNTFILRYINNKNRIDCIFDLESVEDLKTLLANEPMKVVFRASEITKTKILDTTLIGQLEEIYNLMSVNGTTKIKITGDLPMPMKVRALKNLSINSIDDRLSLVEE